MGNLVCDAVRAKTHADVVLVASSAIENALFAGPLVAQDVYDALPYTDQIAIARLSGEQLQQLLDLSASASGTGGFSQVSGVRFRILGGVATEIAVGGQPLEADRAYSVALPFYQVRYNEVYSGLLAAGAGLGDTGVTVQGALIEYIRAHSPLDPRLDGRIAPE